MKILSYKILSEQAFQVGNRKSGLLGAKLATQQGGNPTFSLTYFKYLVKISFGIAPISGTVQNFISSTFAVNFEGNQMFLYPYYDEKVAALEETNAKKWGSLKLYDLNDATSEQDIEGYFLNPSDLEFRFLFKIGDLATFNQVNKLYRFANLDFLSRYQGGPTADFKIRMTNTIMRDLSISRNQSNVNNKYFIDIKFDPAISGYTNPVTGRYKITFNNARKPNINILGFNNITSFTKDGTSFPAFYIYTQQVFTTTPNTDVNCHVAYYENNSYKQSGLIKYEINSLYQS
jgi:hypothetical protein